MRALNRIADQLLHRIVGAGTASAGCAADPETEWDGNCYRTCVLNFRCVRVCSAWTCR